MTTEELNAIIAKAEGGYIVAMKALTHIYGVSKATSIFRG